MLINNCRADAADTMCGLDALPSPTIEKKIVELQAGKVIRLTQASQYANPDHRITISEALRGSLLQSYAICPRGIVAGDGERWFRQFWEFTDLKSRWRPLQAASSAHHLYSGRTQVIDWASEGIGMLRPGRGNKAYGATGIAVSRMRSLNVTLYTGELYEQSVAVIVPHDKSHIPALWSYCSSAHFYEEIRKLDNKVNVTPATLLKGKFDLPHWKKVAEEKYPHGLPKPSSSDPTQWLFNGHPKGADQPLHVAVARLLGYAWPRQTGSSFPDCPSLGPDGLERLADGDGIVCLSATKGKAPAPDRLRTLLAKALGAYDLKQLLATAGPKGSKSETLDEWLRDEFFEQHCALFHQRPFIWHICDGLRNGFGALVNYHKLTYANLEKLTFAYLGDWMRRQQAAVEAGEAGSDARFQAAKNLQTRLSLILDGEPPYDLFVRWKPVSKQAIGWHPDLNDGVRLNIRPFMVGDFPSGKRGAGVLRTKPNIEWDRDRGKEPVRGKAEYPWFWGWDEEKQDFAGVGQEPDGNRWNNCHYSNEFKKKAREVDPRR